MGCWHWNCIHVLEIAMKAYRILSLDGGGIRGLITAILLSRLTDALPGLIQAVDLIAGTSTGGLIALGLAAGMSPHELRRLYLQFGEQVFTDSVIDDLKDLGSLVGANYSNQRLRQILNGHFGEMKLGDLQKKVLISAFDLDNNPTDARTMRMWKAKFFHNFEGEDSDADQSVVNVALYTSAAPVYFPIVNGFIDGGVVASNPSMCALAQALHPQTGAQRLDQVILLSIGTGYNPHFIEVQEGDWGMVQWAPHIIPLMLEGSSGLADYQCRQLLAERYFRLNPRLPFAIGMDRVDKMPLMEEIASCFDLSPAIKWISQYYMPPPNQEAPQSNPA